MKKFINKHLKVILMEFITNDFAGLLWIFAAILVKVKSLKVLSIITYLVFLLIIMQFTINIILFFISIVHHKKPYAEGNTETVRSYLSIASLLLMTQFVFNNSVISNISFILLLILGVSELIYFLLCIVNEVLDAANESLDDFQK
ncbi:hypothetical protein [Clostridium oryzae]|uniref:Uncharacterized protein n=1 Tax=Clostridium oryzae TaxID=1450648 RepID=A0A1V4IRP0_9CLOT|nr:hypothetical protein [Clostridium oryzae]OPJ62573.1 hypothetical protein CLORY_17030 [Clostridium oryzae]